MKLKPILRIGVYGCALMILHGCGGGGGSATPAPVDTTPPVVPTTPVVPVLPVTPVEPVVPVVPVEPIGSAPIITTQPQALTVTEGASATFRVSAVANPGATTGTLAYQWQRNGSDIAGATASSYTLSTTQRDDDQARFAVRVTDSTGSLASAGAVLTVQPVPTNQLYWVAGYADIVRFWHSFPVGPWDGTGSQARFLRVTSLAVAADGTAYVADQCEVRKIAMPATLGATPSGVVTTLAGAECGYGDGPGLNFGRPEVTARFGKLTDVAPGSGGELFLADPDNHAIRKMSATGMVSTYAGGPTMEGYTDGVLAQARFNRPSALARDSAGNLYVLDMMGTPLGQSSRQQDIHAGLVMRRISPDGVVSTLRGGTLNAPVRAGHLALDAAGNVYVSVLAHRLNGSNGGITGTMYTADAAYVLKISPQGVAQVLAGSSAPGSLGAVDGVGASARFRTPAGLAIDNQGRVLVADEDNYAVRRITPAGAVSTVVGMLGNMLVFNILSNVTWPQKLPSTLWRPEGLTIGPYNRVYLSSGQGSYPWSETIDPPPVNNTGLFIAEPR